jgi:hypothetical protein
VDLSIYLISAMLQAQMHAQAQAQEHHGFGHGGSTMDRFKRMNPPFFKGESEPLKAESWLREIEKVFRAIECDEVDKV